MAKQGYMRLNFLHTTGSHLVDSASFGEGANSAHVGSPSPAAMETIPSGKKNKEKKDVNNYPASLYEHI